MSDQATRVLLIEDNPGDADLVRLRLVEGKSLVEVTCVDRLADGIASLGLHPPSLVLLDLNLPDSHGAETFRTVMAHSPDVPVVILSGQDDEALALKAVHQGVQDYLIKGDITSKQLERAMRYAVERQALLRSLEITRKQQLEFKNQFLSHVSHELRTPLTCIHQYVTILLDGLAGPMAPEQSDHLKTVLKSVNQLHAMIRDLLEATRAESGKIRVEPRCISIGELVQQAVTMMRPIAGERQVGIEIGLDNRIPLVHADPDRILEVLINLTDNAIKFTSPEGSVMVKACMVEADEDAVYVSVTDTGRGISPDAKALIFERLYQDPELIDNNRTGLGLGLFICRELVKLHGGKIWVASEPGQGSTFTFTLPLYSLAKLLSPVIVFEQRLRDRMVLVKVELTPLSKTPRGNWREIWQQSLETLRRCVYLDKDLVLPPIGGSAAAQTFFVVASTDLERSGIMMARIRGQLERNEELKASARLVISAVPVDFATPPAETSLDKQVQAVATRVTEIIMAAMEAAPASGGNGHATSNSIPQVQSIQKESSKWQNQKS
jgi:sigma-B regulation protein RsbU (phosphoserine phosphatase)